VDGFTIIEDQLPSEWKEYVSTGEVWLGGGKPRS